MIGGYGGFGARLSRRLAERGQVVLVGGRNLERARRAAAALPRAEPVAVDRAGDVRRVLEYCRPDLVIDAAGPFQGSAYSVPAACIAAGVPYLDLADARDFVCGIGALDPSARQGGVAVVSGASSIPALSGAIARHLADGLERVASVDIAISASNQASAGASVAEAILSSVGHPVRLWRASRWETRRGWQEQRRVRFEVSGVLPIARRLVALCDAPDHALLPPMLPGQPAITFRAGTELPFQMRALWLASWPVAWGWVGSLRPLAGWLRPLQRLTARAGTDRSAMKMVLKGWRAGRAVQRRWTLIAEQGDGPEIPTLAAVLIAEDLLAGRIAAGARDASSLLELDRFEPLFAALNVRSEVVEVRTQPLYERVLGERFAALPASVRALHEVHGDAAAAGEGEVRRGRSWIGRIAGWLTGFPPAGRYPLRVDFREEDGVERWTRHFGPHSFASSLSQHGHRLVERFGPLRFRFELPSDSSGLEMILVGWSCLGLPLPLALAPRTTAREWQEGGRFRFDVKIALPLAGEVIHYSGWLRPAARAGLAAAAPEAGATVASAQPTGR